MKGYINQPNSDVYIRKLEKDITEVTSANGIGEYSDIASAMGVNIITTDYIDCAIPF